MALLSASALGQNNPVAKPVRVNQATGAAADSATLNLAGSLAHLASAGGWDTSLTLVNLGTAAGEARLNFYTDAGSPWELPYTLPQQPTFATTTGSSIDQSLNAHAVLVI